MDATAATSQQFNTQLVLELHDAPAQCRLRYVEPHRSTIEAARITTDMGGTSFDVGIIVDKKPLYSSTSSVNRYEYFIPKVEIRAIGSGGGSLVRIDEATRSLRVGPESAGASPGPICYERGGTVPTVTDANVVLGYLVWARCIMGQMVSRRT